MKENAPYTREELEKLYKEHVAEEIASLFGVPLLRIYADLRRFGITVRPAGQKPVLIPPEKDKLIELDSIYSERELGKILGVSRKTIQRWKRKLGIVSTRKQGERLH